MGMFDKKHRDDVDDKTNRAPAKGAEPAPTPAPPVKAPVIGFGIAKAISLMKSMPNDSGLPSAHVKVIKKTLEAVGVEVSAIIEDGNRRTDAIRTEVSSLEAQLKALDQEMAQKRSKVSELQAEMKDIQSVHECFTADPAAVTAAAPPPPPAPARPPRSSVPPPPKDASSTR